MISILWIHLESYNPQTISTYTHQNKGCCIFSILCSREQKKLHHFSKGVLKKIPYQNIHPGWAFIPKYPHRVGFPSPTDFLHTQNLVSEYLYIFPSNTYLKIIIHNAKIITHNPINNPMKRFQLIARDHYYPIITSGQFNVSLEDQDW